MMKVLVTGGLGQLGQDVLEALERRNIPCLGVDRDDFDLTHGEDVSRFVADYAPTAIVHCAAYTAVDRAEKEPEVCCAINGMGTMNIVRAANACGAKMVYISTDYVFNGTGTRPWEPEDETEPLNVYGLSKAQGETAVRSLLKRFFILRTSWVFGAHGNNFVRTMLRLGAEKSELRVVGDQIGSPTYTRDLAALIVEMIQTGKYGIYHARNEGFISWAEFAEMIMRKAKLPCRIIPIPSAEYPTAARRPLNSRMNGSKIQANGFTPLPSVEDALDRFLREIDTL